MGALTQPQAVHVMVLSPSMKYPSLHVTMPVPSACSAIAPLAIPGAVVQLAGKRTTCIQSEITSYISDVKSGLTHL